MAPAPRGGAGPGDPAPIPPMAIGAKHPEQCKGQSHGLGACLPRFPHGEDAPGFLQLRCTQLPLSRQDQSLEVSGTVGKYPLRKGFFRCSMVVDMVIPKVKTLPYSTSLTWAHLFQAQMG